MTACIRRPTSTWTLCSCDDCRKDSARMAKLVRTGRYTRVSNDEAWKVMDTLIARDWTALAISSATGIPARSIGRVFRGVRHLDHRNRFGPHHAAALLNVGTPTEGMVGATGACRRLRGLARQGWDLYRLADLTGIRFSTLGQIRNGSTRRLTAANDNIIRDAARRIGLDIGPSDQARAHAARVGWPGILAWLDIDDPTEDATARMCEEDRWVRWWESRGYTDVDESAVERILGGDWRLRCSKADREAVVARWTGSWRELEDLTGWKLDRYLTREDTAA
jgi:transcriptional regulator with XRE-family HTH domain